VFTGDEEHPGEPLADARRALIDAAQHSDVALAFEAGNRADATVARRGASAWRVIATGRQAHSSGVFGEGAGYGAIYEVARILDAFRTQLVGEQYLTFNTATIVGGTDVSYDTVAISGTALSKLNIVPSHAVAHGDLRFISDEQLQRTRERMRAIVAQHLPGTDATIVFPDEYPAMSPTPGNARLERAGETPMQAIVAATSLKGEALGLWTGWALSRRGLRPTSSRRMAIHYATSRGCRPAASLRSGGEPRGMRCRAAA